MNAQYVSIIKSNMNKKVAGGGVRGHEEEARPPIREARRNETSMTVMEAAVALIRSAGGLDKARATLDTIEQIRSLV